MSERPNPESQNHSPKFDLPDIDDVSLYLLSRLEQAGSLEALVLDIQHGYTGTRTRSTSPTEIYARDQVHVMSSPNIPSQTYSTSEFPLKAAQLSQLMRSVWYVTRDETHTIREGTPSEPTHHAAYAGAVLAMSIADFNAPETSHISQSISHSINERHKNAWITATNHYKGFGIDESVFTTLFPGNTEMDAIEDGVHYKIAKDLRQEIFEYRSDLDEEAAPFEDLIDEHSEYSRPPKNTCKNRLLDGDKAVASSKLFKHPFKRKARRRPKPKHTKNRSANHEIDRIYPTYSARGKHWGNRYV